MGVGSELGHEVLSHVLRLWLEGLSSGMVRDIIPDQTNNNDTTIREKTCSS